MEKFLTPLILITVLYASSRALTPCHICGKEGNVALKHPLGWIEKAHATCVEVTINTFKKTLSPKQCRVRQQEYKECCDGTYLPPMPPNTPKIPRIPHVGPHPVCNLCKSKRYPSDPSHVINLLYLGASTCKDYFAAGLRGKIPKYLCDPLKFYASDPCGC